MLLSIDPETGEEVARYDAMSDQSLEGAVARAHAAAKPWARASFEERARPLRAAAALLRERAQPLAELMAREMGKPLAQGRGEAEKCAWVCEHFAERAAEYLAPEPLASGYPTSFAAFRPLGVTLAIMPWNFPLWQVFRFAAPTLMAGNAGLLKHAPNVTGCALAIERLLLDAGLPDDLFAALRIEEARVAGLIADPRVRLVTLTGSTRAGRAVGAAAGGSITKCVLELGGSDPYLILDDAALEGAVEASVASRLINSGQSCIAAKRVIAVDAVHDEVVRRLVERMARVRVGSAFAPDTEVGPLARRDLRVALADQVERSVERGARRAYVGDAPDGPAFHPVGVLTDVRPGMPAWDEELFGPVLSVIRVADEREAVMVANDTPFGLGAAVFTADVARGTRIAAEELDAGCCFVNDFVRSDPRLPFGGVKQSGYGRELSAFGIRELVNIKTVAVQG